MGIAWLIAIIAFIIIETVTVQFVSIWFAGGALCALIAELLGANVMGQWIVFVVASAIILVLTRPLVKKLSKKDLAITGTDMLIGKTAVMTKDTDNLGDLGEAKADGKFWTAKSLDGEPIQKDTVVTIEKIEGVKLIVKK